MEAVDELLRNFNGDLVDLCYKLVNEFDDYPRVFQYVCERFVAKPENGNHRIDKYFSPEEVTEYQVTIGDSIDGLINSTMRKCDYGLIKPTDFYTALWQSYCANFSTIKERAFAFYYTIIDKKIPYQYIGKPLSMDDERYKELIISNKENIRKLEYIANGDYKQRTERASLILSCLNQIDDFESKVVILAKAIQIFEKRVSEHKIDYSSLIEEIDRRIADLQTEIDDK